MKLTQTVFFNTFKPLQKTKNITFKGLTSTLKKPAPEKDIFIRTTSAEKAKKVDYKLSQNLTEYPINQFYVLLLDKEFLNGQGPHNNFGSIYEDEDIFCEWFSEKSLGILSKKLPRIPINGPTGCKTIWEAMNDKSRAHELIPLYILATDWYYNNDNIQDPNMTRSVVQLAISRLESDMKVDLSEYSDKNYHYEEYLKKKIRRSSQ